MNITMDSNARAVNVQRTTIGSTYLVREKVSTGTSVFQLDKTKFLETQLQTKNRIALEYEPQNTFDATVKA